MIKLTKLMSVSVSKADLATVVADSVILELIEEAIPQLDFEAKRNLCHQLIIDTAEEVDPLLGIKDELAMLAYKLSNPQHCSMLELMGAKQKLDVNELFNEDSSFHQGGVYDDRDLNW